MNKIRYVIAILLAVTLPTITPAAVSDDTRVCTTTSPVVYEYVKGNVIIPAGQVCRISRSTILGNVQSDGAIDVTVEFSDLYGNVQIKKATGVIDVVGNQMRGNLQLEEQQSGSIEVRANIFLLGYAMSNIQLYKNTVTSTIEVITNHIPNGNIQVFTNAAAPYYGSINVSYNSVAGNLQCKENSPPALAVFNSVGGESSC